MIVMNVCHCNHIISLLATGHSFIRNKQKNIEKIEFLIFIFLRLLLLTTNDDYRNHHAGGGVVVGYFDSCQPKK